MQNWPDWRGLPRRDSIFNIDREVIICNTLRVCVIVEPWAGLAYPPARFGSVHTSLWRTPYPPSPEINKVRFRWWKDWPCCGNLASHIFPRGRRCPPWDRGCTPEGHLSWFGQRWFLSSVNERTSTTIKVQKLVAITHQDFRPLDTISICDKQ